MSLVERFATPAECYGEKTGNIPGDLGVSLSESTLMRIESYTKGDLNTPGDSEWFHFARDNQEYIDHTIEIRDILREKLPDIKIE